MAILVSGFVSLTLTPMLCSRFLRPPGSERHGQLYAVTERCFDRMLDGYQRSLSWVMRHRRATMYFSGALLLATVYMFYAIPKGFLPSEDTGQLIIFTLAAQGISYDSMVEHQLAAASLIKDDPSIRSYFVSVGSGGPGGATNGNHISASEAGVGAQAQRRPVDHEVAAGAEQRARAARLPAESAADPDRRAIHAQHVPVDAAEPEHRDALPVRAAARIEVRQLPDLRGVNSDLQVENPQVNVDIDRDKAHALGVSAGAIEDALYNAYGSRQISTIYAPNDEYWVIMEVEPQYQAEPCTLSLLYVRSSSGPLVPLDTLVKFTRSLGPLAGQPLGTAAVGHDFIRRRARRFARQGARPR